MTEVKRCSLCNTSWPEGELNSHGLCKYCRGEEDIRGDIPEDHGIHLEIQKKKAGKDQLELFEEKEFV